MVEDRHGGQVVAYLFNCKASKAIWCYAGAFRGEASEAPAVEKPVEKPVEEAVEKPVEKPVEQVDNLMAVHMADGEDVALDAAPSSASASGSAQVESAAPTQLAPPGLSLRGQASKAPVVEKPEEEARD
jgi:uncharacterized protein YoaH (UPF0181 family)